MIAARRVLLAVGLSFAAAAPCFFGAAFVCGRSMEPTLFPGDLVVYSRRTEVSRGEVVVFSKRGWPGGVVHRVTGILPDGRVRTRGDANPVEDLTPLAPDALRGRRLVVIPAGRLLASLAARHK